MVEAELQRVAIEGFQADNFPVVVERLLGIQRLLAKR